MVIPPDDLIEKEISELDAAAISSVLDRDELAEGEVRDVNGPDAGPSSSAGPSNPTVSEPHGQLRSPLPGSEGGESDENRG